jgi:hypothetical protein
MSKKTIVLLGIAGGLTVILGILLIITGSAHAALVGLTRSRFVGGETCTGCHRPPIGEPFAGDSWTSDPLHCEACHGPGSQHVAEPATADMHASAASCTGCDFQAVTADDAVAHLPLICHELPASASANDLPLPTQTSTVDWVMLLSTCQRCHPGD